MAEVKHTSGPWFEQPGFSDDVEITAESREGMVPICSMDLGFTGYIGVEQEANARLIAAAPDLFEALREAKGLADMAEMYDGPGEPSVDQKQLIALRAKIDAALSKATTQQEGR